MLKAFILISCAALCAAESIEFDIGSDDCEDNSTCASHLLQFRASRETAMGRCSDFKVKGKVQMVHYRNWVNAKAHKYGVKGWVANGGDRSRDGQHARCSTCGAVLGHVEGNPGAVRRFLQDVCRGGPPRSYVTSCSTFSSSCFSCPSFYKEFRFCNTWEPKRCKSRC
eukprot:TRINITY_DN108346_c0_g1_i1.p1 TRINITY_DN108346_c0_g1~~TRINITY_DN108346_c0_g1_i1.p1  ORF type:complete len:168 (-),score=23.65 TRINITY_DN108346_c0_g1_i1:36-539(-)